MAVLNSKRFNTLVADWAAAAQGASSKLLDLTTGSILRAINEASNGNVLWLQGIAYQILGATRLSTSQGSDVDTWLADWMPAAEGGELLSTGQTSPRLPSREANGTVRFSRKTPSQLGIIPVGSQVMTFDGRQIFEVIADQGNMSFELDASAYYLMPGVTAVEVPVRAIVSGTGGNVLADTVTLMRSGIPGIDEVTNPVAFSDGENKETDAQAKARFPKYIVSLARSTEPAIEYAVALVKQGLQVTVTENLDYQGNPDIGYMSLVVDDGSGAPTPDLILAVAQSVNRYRAATVRFGVFGPVIIGVDVSYTVETAEGYDHNTLVGMTADAVAAHIDNLGLARPLRWSKLEQIIYDTSPGVTNALGLLVNGAELDIVPTFREVVKPLAVTAS